MAEPAKNGILEYLESVRSDNPETFTEHQTGIGRKGFRKYIPDPTQVADFLNFPQKNGIRTLTPDVPIKVDPSNKYYNPNTEYFAGEDGQYYSTTSGGTRLYHQPDGSLAAFPKERGVGDFLDEMGSELSYLNSEQFLKDNPEAEYSPIALGGKAYRAIQNMPEHDEEAFMDEYYGEYPERSADTALGILSAFPALSGVRLGKAVHGMIKNPAKFSRLSKAEQNKLDWLSVKPVLQLLGLFGATLDTGLEKRGRREKEAEEMGIPFSEHPEFQKKADGGSIYEAEKSYDYDPSSWGPVLDFLKAEATDPVNLGLNLASLTPWGAGIRFGKLGTKAVPAWLKGTKEHDKLRKAAALDKRATASKKVGTEGDSFEQVHGDKLREQAYDLEREVFDSSLWKKNYVAPKSKSKSVIPEGGITNTQSAQAAKREIDKTLGTNISKQKLMPKGFKTREELMDDYNKKFSSVVDDIIKPTPPKDYSNMGIMELLEEIIKTPPK